MEGEVSNTAPVTDASSAEVDPKQGAVQEAAKEATKRMLKVKIDKEIKELPEDEVIKGYSHQQAANKRMQEGIRLQKEYEARMAKLKSKDGLFEIIRELGHDPRQLSEEFLSGEIKREMMDPRERKLMEYEAKLKEYEARDAEERTRAEQREFEELKAKHAEEYNKQFMQALEESKLPKSKDSVRSMAKYMSDAVRIGYPITAMEAAKLVEQDLINTWSASAKDLDPAEFVRLFGEEAIDKIRKWDMSRVKDPLKDSKVTPEQQGERRTTNRTKRYTPAEWAAFKRGQV